MNNINNNYPFTICDIVSNVDEILECIQYPIWTRMILDTNVSDTTFCLRYD